jgi:uncharacterized protein with von Willebrand factor type A (vWA) domain
MLLGFLEHLRRYRVPVSLREYIDLLALLKYRLAFADQDDFYFLSRLSLVKDEKYYDRFDQAFASYFDGVDRWVGLFGEETNDVRETLLQLVGENRDIDKLLVDYQAGVSELREALLRPADADPADQVDGDNGSGGRNTTDATESGDGEDAGEGDGGDAGEGDGGEEGEGDGGEKGEGDDGDEGEGHGGRKGLGTSEEGEEGERQDEVDVHRHRATKVWLDRAFEDYDPDVELGTRNLKMALRRLRRWAREAADLELDLPGTIRSTARNGGMLDIIEVPERHNAVKVLMLLDVGGSMDEHIELCAQLFSAASSEFKYLDTYYFHNFIYEGVWTENERRFEDRVPTWQLMHRYGKDWKVIIVGDADMARHEVTDRGGSVEHFNAEPGEVWLQRLMEQFRSVVWLNPVPETRWRDSFSIQMIEKRIDSHMYFLSDSGLEKAMKQLMK